MKIKKEYRVTYPWRDLEDTAKSFPEGREYVVNDLWPAINLEVTEERIDELMTNKNKIGRPLITPRKGE